MDNRNGTVDGYADGEEPLVFHYGKPGERLKHADESVRNFYEGKGPQPPKGLFKSLVQTRTSRFMFLTVIAFTVIVFALQFLGGNPAAGTVGGIPVSLAAFSFEDTVYVSIKLEETRTGENSLVPVNADIRLYDTDKQLIATAAAEGFYRGKEEFLRTTAADYDIVYIEAVLNTPDGSVTLTAGVTGN